MFDKYIELISKEVEKKVFQKEIKNKDFKKSAHRLVSAFNKAYKTDGYVDRHMVNNDTDKGFVFAPGIIKSKRTGEINLALLDISLNDGGEHFGTRVFLEEGIINLHDEELDEKYKHLLIYEYMPFIYISGDHHIDYDDYSLLIEAGIMTKEEANGQ